MTQPTTAPLCPPTVPLDPAAQSKIAEWIEDVQAAKADLIAAADSGEFDTAGFRDQLARAVYRLAGSRPGAGLGDEAELSWVAAWTLYMVVLNEATTQPQRAVIAGAMAEILTFLRELLDHSVDGFDGRQATLQTLTVAEILDLPPLRYQVEDLVPAGSLVVVYGPWKQGKTFLCLDLALHIAMGWPWMGRRVKQGRVLYVAAEGQGGLRNRIAAWVAHHDDVIPSGFELYPRPVNMLDVTAAETLARYADEQRFDVVFLDTLARSIPGGEENSTKDMNQFVANCDLVREQAGAAVIPVHHPGKDLSKGMRGSSALPGAVDAVLEVHKTSEDTIQARIETPKDFEPGAPLRLRLRTIDLGHDDEGRSVTSCVVVADESNTPDATQDIVTKALATFREAFGATGATQSQLRDTLEEAHGISRRAAYNWITKLLELGILRNEGSDKRPFLVQNT